MKEKPIFGRTLRWTWAISAAVMVHVGLYWGVAWTRSSDQKLKRQDRQFTEIEYFDAKTVDQSELMTQRMSLFDPRPLLLPTEWNAANAARLWGGWQEEAEIFPEFTPMFELEDGNYLDDFGNVQAYYDGLSAAQSEFTSPLFRQLGRRDEGVEFKQAPGVALLVVNPLDGVELSRIIIYNDAVRAFLGEWPDWKPVTMLATVKDSFQLGGLSVLASSGFDAADRQLGVIAYAHFSRLGQLEDGVYLLEISP